MVFGSDICANQNHGGIVCNIFEKMSINYFEIHKGTQSEQLKRHYMFLLSDQATFVDLSHETRLCGHLYTC